MASIVFSKKIKKARMDAGFTQKDIYERLDISQSTFSSWEIGKSEPSAEVLIKLCEWYNIDSLSYFTESHEQKDDIMAKNTIAESSKSNEKNSLRKDEIELLEYYNELDTERRAELRGELKGILKEINRTKGEMSLGKAN